MLICTTLMVAVNYSVAMPMSASVLFPVLALLKTQSFAVFGAAALAGIVIAVSHFEIVLRIKRGEEEKVRDIIKKKIFNIE